MLQHIAENSVRFLWKNWFYWVIAMVAAYLLLVSSTIFISINPDFLLVLGLMIFAHNYFIVGLGMKLEKIKNLDTLSFSDKWMFIINFYVFTIIAPVYLLSECIYDCYIA